METAGPAVTVEPLPDELSAEPELEPPLISVPPPPQAVNNVPAINIENKFLQYFIIISLTNVLTRAFYIRYHYLSKHREKQMRPVAHMKQISISQNAKNQKISSVPAPPVAGVADEVGDDGLND
jgi:hypothetical protein